MSETSQGGGIGFVGTLTIAFIVLKLTEVIDWSWWSVFSPVWLSFCFVFIVMVVAFFVAAYRR